MQTALQKPQATHSSLAAGWSKAPRDAPPVELMTRMSAASTSSTFLAAQPSTASEVLMGRAEKSRMKLYTCTWQVQKERGPCQGRYMVRFDSPISSRGPI